MSFYKTIIILIITCTLSVYSRPEYSMLSGNRCLTCHFNSQGGALRTQLGSYSKTDVGIIQPSSIGLKGVYDFLNQNTCALDETLFYGVDYRLESVRMPNISTGRYERKYMQMQLTPYLAYQPFNWLTFQGQYNLVATGYAGQKHLSASVIIQPLADLPLIQIGLIKPSIGMLYDDHTMLTTMVQGIGYATPLIPPDYIELGAEINYDPLKWLSLTAGAFKANSISEILVADASGNAIPLVDTNQFQYLGKISFTPRFFNNKLNTDIGASYFFSKDFYINNFFALFGLTDELSLCTEYVISEKKTIRKTNNWMVELMYQISTPIQAFIRYERAKTDDYTLDANLVFSYIGEQYVFGLSFNPLPFFELRPEYRINKRLDVKSYSAEYAVQLHVFY